MKELYVSPELELLCLTAEERLANNQIDYDDLMGGVNNGDAVTPSDNDIDVPLDLSL